MIEDYKVEAALSAINGKCLGREEVRGMLEAAANAKPPEKVVVTEEMIEAGCRAAWQETPWKVMMHRDVAVSIYRAMHALAPLPEVTDEAVSVALKAYGQAPNMTIGILNALTAALPIILGRK